MKQSSIKTLLFSFIIISLFSNNYSHAQEDKEIIKDSIYSNVLKEMRNIQIVLPEGYDSNATDKYDVIYVVDGEWNTDIMTKIHNWTSGWNFMPKNIIVGIENKYIEGVNQRNRDFTPTPNDSQPLSGKAINFLTFIKEQLIPYINENYLTTDNNTLFGHSHGGTFTIYTLLKEPHLFKSYIATDPSLWWDNRYMSKFAAERLPELSDISATLHISGRSGGNYEGMGIVAMDSVLKLKAPKGLLWESNDYPNEIHNSVRFKGIYDGLKLTYKGYTNKEVEFHPMGGIIEKNKSFNVLRVSDNTSIHYTTDGSEPSLNSPKMEEIITLNGPAELKAKAVSIRSTNNKITTHHFIEGKAFKPINKPKKVVSGGLNYKYYEGEWNQLPNFKKLKSIKTGVADKNFNLNNLPNKNNFACVFNGYFEAKEDGYYAFGIASDDGSQFYINGKLILDNDGVHNSESFKSYMIPLKTGFYPVRLEYFQKDGDSRYTLLYLKPGSTDAMPVPFELQYFNN